MVAKWGRLEPSHPFAALLSLAPVTENELQAKGRRTPATGLWPAGHLILASIEGQWRWMWNLYC